jgi:hypothetical protein
MTAIGDESSFPVITPNVLDAAYSGPSACPALALTNLSFLEENPTLPMVAGKEHF